MRENNFGGDITEEHASKNRAETKKAIKNGRRPKCKNGSLKSRSKSKSNEHKKHKKLRFSNRAPSPEPHLVNQGKTIKSDRYWSGFKWIERVNASNTLD